MKAPKTPTRATPPESVEPAFLSRMDAATRTGFSPQYLDKRAREGVLAYYKPSKRKVLFAVADLDSFMSQFRVDANEPSPFESPIRERHPDGKYLAKGGRK